MTQILTINYSIETSIKDCISKMVYEEEKKEKLGELEDVGWQSRGTIGLEIT